MDAEKPEKRVGNQNFLIIMKKSKLSLDQLKVNSFVTDVKKNEVKTVKGGRLSWGCPPSLNSDCCTDAECYLSIGDCPI